MRVGLCVALVVASGSAFADARPPSQGSEERSVIDLSPGKGQSFKELSIDNSLGDIRVEGHDGDDLIIVAEKHAPDRATLERVKVSLVPEPDGSVGVRTRLMAGAEARPLRAGTIRVDLVIRAPRSAQVRARTWNGRVAVEGVDNGADLAANEGDIHVTKVLGAVTTSSAQGEHEVSDVVGEVSTKSLIGDVRMTWIRGRRLTAVVHRGSVIAKRVQSREVDIKAVRGDVTLGFTDAAVRDIQVRTLHGDVRVEVADAPETVAVLAKRGRVQIDRGLGAALGETGEWIGGRRGTAPGTRVSIRTGYGNVVFSVAPSAVR